MEENKGIEEKFKALRTSLDLKEKTYDKIIISECKLLQETFLGKE